MPLYEIRGVTISREDGKLKVKILEQDIKTGRRAQHTLNRREKEPIKRAIAWARGCNPEDISIPEHVKIKEARMVKLEELKQDLRVMDQNLLRITHDLGVLCGMAKTNRKLIIGLVLLLLGTTGATEIL